MIMRHYILDTGGWILAHGWLLLGAVAVVAAWLWMMRRRRARRPMVTIDLTGMHLSAAAVIYDREMVDAIADRSFAAGIFVGALGLVAVMLVIIVLCLRGSENRPRNGREVS